MSATKIRCFFNADGKLTRSVLPDNDEGLKFHQPQEGETVADIPFSDWVAASIDGIEAYYAARKG